MESDFSIYAAILADSVSSTSEQFKGLMAHMCLMIQFLRILGAWSGCNMTMNFGFEQLVKE